MQVKKIITHLNNKSSISLVLLLELIFPETFIYEEFQIAMKKKVFLHIPADAHYRKSHHNIRTIDIRFHDTKTLFS